MRVRGTIAALALFGALLLAPAAQATYDPLASGQATLTLQPSLRTLLKKEGIKLSGRKGASVKAQRTATLPVSGGEADPTISKGTWELEGELIFSTQTKQVPLTFIQVKAKPQPLFAKVGGGQQKLVRSSQESFKREGFAYGYEARDLKLSPKTATRLDKRLKTKAFQANQILGSLEVSANPATVTVLPQGKATLVLAPSLTAKLSALHVSRNPIFGAEHQGDTFTFPIIPGGQLAPDFSQGTLRTGGSIEFLQLSGLNGQLFWHELWIQPTQVLAEAEALPSPPYAGKQGQPAILSLGPGEVSSDPQARTITITSAPLTLTSLTAEDLDRAFAEGRGEFKAGEAAGTVSFTAQGQ